MRVAAAALSPSTGSMQIPTAVGGWQRHCFYGHFFLVVGPGLLSQALTPPELSPHHRAWSACRYEGDYLVTHDLGNSFIRMPMRFSWRQVSVGPSQCTASTLHLHSR